MRVSCWHQPCNTLCDCVVNNLSGSFNSLISEARDKPILAMLEWIRVRLMTKLYKKMKGIEKYIRCVLIFKTN